MEGGALSLGGTDLPVCQRIQIGMKPMPLAQPTKRTSDGGITYDVSINVSMAEMQAWSPDRIASFFSGLARVLAAKNG